MRIKTIWKISAKKLKSSYDTKKLFISITLMSILMFGKMNNCSATDNFTINQNLDQIEKIISFSSSLAFVDLYNMHVGSQLLNIKQPISSNIMKSSINKNQDPDEVQLTFTIRCQGGLPLNTPPPPVAREYLPYGDSPDYRNMNLEDIRKMIKLEHRIKISNRDPKEKGYARHPLDFYIRKLDLIVNYGQVNKNLKENGLAFGGSPSKPDRKGRIRCERTEKNIRKMQQNIVKHTEEAYRSGEVIEGTYQKLFENESLEVVHYVNNKTKLWTVFNKDTKKFITGKVLTDNQYNDLINNNNVRDF